MVPNLSLQYKYQPTFYEQMLLYLALNSFHQIFSLIQFNPEVRLLLDAEGGLIL